MINKYLITIFISVLTLLPLSASALSMPKDGSDLAGMFDLNANSYIVQDISSGQILIAKNADQPWTPASLTKLVTALVVLDTKPKLSKIVVMQSSDQINGQCSAGGACVKSKAGVKFTVDGLFHAILMPSANNAAYALARSTGLTVDQFAARMNKKVAELGATNSHFLEPSGLNAQNSITAQDYAKIVSAAFSNPYLLQIGGLKTYYLHSTNSAGYNQTIKNTDKLLADNDVQILGAKTGYLNESAYNFGALLKNRFGQKLAVVVLGENHLSSAFLETKLLANLADVAQMLAMENNFGQVLGAVTQ